MDGISLLVPLLLAFSSSPHCLGMCGGIIGAASFHRSRIHGRNGKHWAFLIAVNAGKMASYSLAGAMAATFGQSLFSRLSLENGHPFLLGLAGVFLIGNGLFLLGYFPVLRQIEAAGTPLWKVLEPLARRLIRAPGPGQGFLLGLVWGWFPCTLVYGTLMWSSASCSAASGALIMAIFGLGTFPSMIGAGWLTGYLPRFGGITRFSKIIAWLLTGIGLFYLFVAVWTAYDPHAFNVNFFPINHVHDNNSVDGHHHSPQTLCPNPL